MTAIPLPSPRANWEYPRKIIEVLGTEKDRNYIALENGLAIALENREPYYPKNAFYTLPHNP